MKKCMGCMADYGEDRIVCPVCGYSEEAADREHAKAPDALCAGTILSGRYIAGRILSFTPFSIVYIGWDALLKQRVVIRELYPCAYCRRGEDETTLVPLSDRAEVNMEDCAEAFEEEAALLNRCQDIPGVLNYYRTFRANGTSYVVTEYLEGITLEDRLSGGKLSVMEAEELLSTIIMILDSLHRRDVYHCNLAPSSIYLCDDGRLMLIDFGAAKRQYAARRGSTEGILDGRYCAPEILGTDVGPAADYYSAGALLYNLLTGRAPKKNFRKKVSIRAGEKTDRLLSLLVSTDPKLRREGASMLRTKEPGQLSG